MTGIFLIGLFIGFSILFLIYIKSRQNKLFDQFMDGYIDIPAYDDLDILFEDEDLENIDEEFEFMYEIELDLDKENTNG